ncbi:MAG: hypothetical protein DKINENOH_00081 [bacterium]|nr:hypothetical protein [bacterium]
MKSFRLARMLLAFIVLWVGADQHRGFAQWSNDPRVNTVWEQPENQGAPVIYTDGDGGAIVAWASERGVFANRVDKLGYRQWGNNGVPVSPPGGLRTPTNIIPDGQGGGIVVWEDFTKSAVAGEQRRLENEMYVQRLDRQGKRLWDSSGVVIRERIVGTRIGDFQILSDDYQTFMLTWYDERQSGQWYIQRLDWNGQIAFEQNGRAIPIERPANNDQRRVVSDGKSGMLMARGNQQLGVVVDKVAKDGIFPWPLGGIPTYTGGPIAMAIDSKGGAIIAGIHFNSQPPNFDAEGRIQRMDSTGKLLWGEGGKIFTPDADVKTIPRIVADGAGGALVTWDDTTNSVRQRFVARYDSDGNRLWKTPGFRIWYHSTMAPTIISNGKGSMIWLVVDFNTPAGDLFAFRVDSSGTVSWGTEGILIRYRNFEEWPYYLEATPDQTGGFIAVWSETRAPGWQNLALQQVNVHGQLGEVMTAVKESGRNLKQPGAFFLYAPFPNPLRPATRIDFVLHQRAHVSLRIVNLAGQEVIRLIEQPLAPGNHTVSWDARDHNKKEVVNGIYFCQLMAGSISQVRKILVIH